MIRQLLTQFIVLIPIILLGQDRRIYIDCPEEIKAELIREFHSCLIDTNQLCYINYKTNMDTIRIVGYIISRSNDSKSVPEKVLKRSTKFIKVAGCDIPIKEKSEPGKVNFEMSHPNFILVYTYKDSKCKIIEMTHYF